MKSRPRPRARINMPEFEDPEVQRMVGDFVFAVQYKEAEMEADDYATWDRKMRALIALVNEYDKGLPEGGPEDE